MTGNSRARQGVPVLLNKEGDQAAPLVRMHWADLGKKDEGWLRDRLLRHPRILPTQAFEQIFSPLVPLGAEVATKDGRIDLLLISPRGYVTLVETKLWRNPESRREVVAQALEYAADVAHWTFTDLDERVRRSKHGRGVLEALLCDESWEPPDETAFRNEVTEHLRAGRILVLVVGDTIRDQAQYLTEVAFQHPLLWFTAGVVDLEVFKEEASGRLLFVPSLVARTVEYERAVVRVDPAAETVGVRLEHLRTAKAGTTAPKRVQRDWDDFFSRLGPEAAQQAQVLVDTASNVGGYCDLRKSGFIARLTLPDQADITLFEVEEPGTVRFRRAGYQLRRSALPVELAENYVRGAAEIFGVDVADSPADRAKDVWPSLRPAPALDTVYAHLGEFLPVLENFVRTVLSAAQQGSQ